MREMTRELRAIFAVLLAVLLLVGCARPLIPAQSPDSSFSEQAAPELKGRVSFGARTVQADMGEVATSATVSLIEATSNVTISSSVTDASGVFSLKFASDFRPSKTTAYFLEAVKGLSVGGDPNRAGASLARVRTLIYWRSGTWKSLSRSGLIVNRSTTALSLIANLRTAASLPVDTEALISSLEVGLADSAVLPATPDTFSPAASQISNDAYHQVFGLVDAALTQDADPLFSISMDVGPPIRFVRTEQGFTVHSVNPATGVSHDTVALSGYGFDPITTNNLVKFNGWPATVLAVSPDRRTLTVKVPRRLGLSGPLSVQIGGILKIGPTWTQTGWLDPFDDAADFKNLVNTSISNGALILQGATSLGFIDSTNADFAGGIRSGFSQLLGADPLDSGDGAINLATNALRVLQVYPDGNSQTVAAQGVYNYRPDLFSFELLPVTTYNTLTTLNDTFTATKVDKSSELPGAIASVGGTVTRTLKDYDILFFGVADSYGSKDLVANSVTLTRSFAQLGRGVVFTHDTLHTSKAFFGLSDLHGLGAGGRSLTKATVYQVPGVDLTSPVMTRPFDMSGVPNFAIQNSHSSNHKVVNATAWYAFDPNLSATPSEIPYWTTMTTETSNAAFFSYGHTQLVPTEFEAKAMINSMYYTYDRGTTISGGYTSRALDSGTVDYTWTGTPFSWVSRRATAATVTSFQVAATNLPGETNLTYVGPDGTSATSFTSPGAVLPALTGRYLRYRTTLSTNTIAEVPLLSRVDVGATFATATSAAIAPNALSNWTTASFGVTPADGVRVQFLDKGGTLIPDVVLPGNSAGFGSSPIDLSGLPANNYPAIRMRLTLLKQGTSPKIDNVRIDWIP